MLGPAFGTRAWDPQVRKVHLDFEQQLLSRVISGVHAKVEI